MIKKLFFLAVYCLFNSSTLLGQCPDRVLLWKRLIYLRDSSSSTPIGQQLSELLKYERDMKACPAKVDSTYTFLLSQIGACYLKKSDYNTAIAYIHKSIHLIDANANRPSINNSQLVGCYYRLSVCYDSLHNIVEKIRAVDSCVAIAIRENSVDVYAMYSLAKSVEYFKDIGDFERCVHYAKLGMVLVENYKQDVSSTEYYIIFLERLVEALIVLERFDEAEKIISTNLFSSRIEQLKKAHQWAYLATIYDHYAEVLTHNRDHEKALYWFGQSIFYDKLNKNFLGCAVTTENIGYYLYFHQLNDYDKAISYYFKALQYARRQLKSTGSKDELDVRIESLNILDNIANAFLAKGRYDSALAYFQKGLDQMKPGMNEKILLESSDRDFLSNRSIRYVLNIIIDKADATLKWGIYSHNPYEIGHAIVIYKTADKLLERIRSEQSEINSKLFWMTDTKRLYNHAIDASFLIHDTANAFYFFEKSRAVLLNDQLNQLSMISSAEILNQAQVKKKILLLETALSNAEQGSARYGEIQTELFKYKQKYDKSEQAIKQDNPVYYQNYMDTTFIDLADVRKQILKDHEVLLELFSGDSAMYSLLITKGSVYFEKIDKNEFDSTAGAFASYLSNSSLLNSRYENFIKTARHLYKLIFKNHPVPDGRMIVSPDAQFFPFEALINDTETGSPDYFLNHHTLSYTYSARFLLNRFSSSSSSQLSFLGVAPVKYPSALHLSDLSGSDISLKKIVSYFDHSTLFLTDKASRRNFQQQFSKYQVIQLYTHASDTSSRGEPVIYFTDSSLYFSDLIPENKPLTRLVVLSACETGLGRLNPGEGVFSFNRGFASLGIPSSIVNLWSVDNESTYRITELFYKNLSAGEPIDIALQKAKVEFIQHSPKQNKLPYYWAAAIVAGKSDGLEIVKVNLWSDILMIAFLMAISYFTLNRMNKRTRR